MTHNIKYKKYPAYKDSGVEWLGEIPEHWEVRKLKHFFKESESLFIDGDWIESNDINGNDVKYFTTGNIGEGYFRYQGDAYITQDTFKRLNCTEVKGGDILISRLNLPLGRCCIAPIIKEPFIVSVDVVICRMDSPYDRKYFVYLMNCTFYQDYAEIEARGAIMKRISRTILSNFYLLLPPLPEQTAIANFLDDKCAKIDKAITGKQKLIALLKERKQIIIQNAVTKGLNPNAKLKDSGVEWIGDVPEGWEVKRLKYVSTIKSGDSITNSELEEEGAFEVYGGNGLMGFTHKYNVDGEKIIIGRVGALCGNIRYSNKKRWISDNALILILNKGESYSYYTILLTAANLNNLNSSNAQPLITGTKVMNFPIPLPPEEEQKSITCYIETESTKIDKAIELQQKQIEKLKEYKATLINSVVTGKIRVGEEETSQVE